jgi:hypothetical protein
MASLLAQKPPQPLKRLHTLNIARCSLLSPTGCFNLFSAFASASSSLTSLNVAECKIDDACVNQFISKVSSLPPSSLLFSSSSLLSFLFFSFLLYLLLCLLLLYYFIYTYLSFLYPRFPLFILISSVLFLLTFHLVYKTYIFGHKPHAMDIIRRGYF